MRPRGGCDSDDEAEEGALTTEDASEQARLVAARAEADRAAVRLEADPSSAEAYAEAMRTAQALSVPEDVVAKCRVKAIKAEHTRRMAIAEEDPDACARLARSYASARDDIVSCLSGAADLESHEAMFRLGVALWTGYARSSGSGMAPKLSLKQAHPHLPVERKLVALAIRRELQVATRPFVDAEIDRLAESGVASAQACMGILYVDQATRNAQEVKEEARASLGLAASKGNKTACLLWNLCKMYEATSHIERSRAFDIVKRLARGGDQVAAVFAVLEAMRCDETTPSLLAAQLAPPGSTVHVTDTPDRFVDEDVVPGTPQPPCASEALARRAIANARLVRCYDARHPWADEEAAGTTLCFGIRRLDAGVAPDEELHRARRLAAKLCVLDASDEATTFCINLCVVGTGLRTGEAALWLAEAVPDQARRILQFAVRSGLDATCADECARVLLAEGAVEEAHTLAQKAMRMYGMRDPDLVETIRLARLGKGAPTTVLFEHGMRIRRRDDLFVEGHPAWYVFLGLAADGGHEPAGHEIARSLDQGDGVRLDRAKADRVRASLPPT